jgi:fructose-bisphosphate aldolase class II/tagatose 1,6-diphosphate aldolase GatY/KbaY
MLLIKTMRSKSLKKYFKRAQKEKWAIGQFNFSTTEQLKGILLAAKKMRSPVILGTSGGESEFLGISCIFCLANSLILKLNINPKTVFLNLDHCKNLELLKKAIVNNYSMVHFDGSKFSLQENIKKTKRAIILAKKKNILTEGEIGIIPKTGEKINKKDLTRPEQVKEFVEKTGIDCLAISFGNIHGFSGSPPKIDFERLKQIKKQTNAFLVFHGGSGTRSQDFKKAIKLGITKININTELRMTWKNSLKQAIKTQEIRPYKILPNITKQIEKLVIEKIKLFGSRNKV